jgi:hypothetical protein
MQSANELMAASHAIQQAVAPVFLLTGVGSILSVLSVRLARSIDRSRVINAMGPEKQPSFKTEMDILRRRVRWIYWAISLCTSCALFICIVIAALFIGSELEMDPSRAISIFFIAAMLALISGLLCFLREIALATGNLKLH